jgi:alanine racemase
MHSQDKQAVSYIQLDVAGLQSNVGAIRAVLKEETEVAVVVKANAYGHGLEQIVGALESAVTYFQIDDIEEHRSLRKFTNNKALILGYVDPGLISEVLEFDTEIAGLSPRHLRELNSECEKASVKVRVHLAVDAYLGREGILSSEIAQVINVLPEYKAIELVGVYAHFANIEDQADFTHATKQISAFNEVVALLRGAGYPAIKTHISATSGILAYEQHNHANTIVRLGIGAYGLWPSQDLRKKHESKVTLRPVVRWVSRVVQVKQLPAGYPIGYGLTYVTPTQKVVAVVPQGYSDGYDRLLSNKGEVLIRGQRCGVLGRVAMNMFVVDATHVDGISQDDEVVLLGAQGQDAISAEEVASKLDTINYEIVARISPLLPRVVR